MKNGRVIKQIGTPDIAEEIRLVNTYSRRELSAEEVYLFTVALCDNDVDRDGERFTEASLDALAQLFVGKTGIIDHNPSAKNQKARIISCRVEQVEGAKTVLGDPLLRLTARAYMRRTEGNAELIEAIDAGIVKEVSVGCSVKRTLCSVCRQELYSPACSHVKGQRYQGELCVGELCEPTDAYEFSFVAVPAQRGAGVIKSEKEERTMKDILKCLEGERVTLAGEEITALKRYIEALRSDADCAAAYRGELLERLEDSMKQKGVALGYACAKSIADKLSIGEIRDLLSAFSDSPAQKAAPQLCRPQHTDGVTNTEFRI